MSVGLKPSQPRPNLLRQPSASARREGCCGPVAVWAGFVWLLLASCRFFSHSVSSQTEQPPTWLTPSLMWRSCGSDSKTRKACRRTNLDQVQSPSVVQVSAAPPGLLALFETRTPTDTGAVPKGACLVRRREDPVLVAKNTCWVFGFVWA